MGRTVPKSKRAAYVYDRDFIVVDDISGVLKMRSQCAIDGYGFLSADGDPRNPQEIAPIIREQMAAWPDPRPISPANYINDLTNVYFIFDYFVVSVQSDSTTFDATASYGFNGPIALMQWYVDGVLIVDGLAPAVSMAVGEHQISVKLTDIYSNSQTFNFDYTQPDTTSFQFIGGEDVDFIDDDPFDFIG